MLLRLILAGNYLICNELDLIVARLICQIEFSQQIFSTLTMNTRLTCSGADVAVMFAEKCFPVRTFEFVYQPRFCVFERKSAGDGIERIAPAFVCSSRKAR